MNPKRALRAAVYRSFVLTCGWRVALNYAKAARYRLGRWGTSSGNIHTAFSLEQSVAYIREVVEDYRRYARRWAGVETLRGHIAELGPGDNAGVALLLRRNGATQVDLVDRFRSDRDPTQQRRIYEAFLASDPVLRAMFGTADPTRDDDFRGVSWHYGPTAAAEEFFRDPPQPFDAIVSRAVLEHLYDPIGALETMARALAPGGVMLHAVDLRDHAMFEGRSPLAWLRVPGPVYRHMTLASGGPNRVLLHRYREALERSGLVYTILVASVVGHAALPEYVPLEDVPAEQVADALARVRAERAGFAAEFHQVRDEDLAVTGIFIVAQRHATDA